MGRWGAHALLDAEHLQQPANRGCHSARAMRRDSMVGRADRPCFYSTDRPRGTEVGNAKCISSNPAAVERDGSSTLAGFLKPRVNRKPGDGLGQNRSRMRKPDGNGTLKAMRRFGGKWLLRRLAVNRLRSEKTPSALVFAQLGQIHVTSTTSTRTKVDEKELICGATSVAQKPMEPLAVGNWMQFWF